jgi:hypothetical protein
MLFHRLYVSLLFREESAYQVDENNRGRIYHPPLSFCVGALAAAQRIG